MRAGVGRDSHAKSQVSCTRQTPRVVTQTRSRDNRDEPNGASVSKYDPLRTFLTKRSGPVTLPLVEITEMVPGGLPRSAYKHEAWWDNDDEIHPHCHSWGDAGFVARPDLAHWRVRFEPR